MWANGALIRPVVHLRAAAAVDANARDAVWIPGSDQTVNVFELFEASSTIALRLLAC
jgi:hypothetical protein